MWKYFFHLRLVELADARDQLSLSFRESKVIRRFSTALALVPQTPAQLFKGHLYSPGFYICESSWDKEMPEFFKKLTEHLCQQSSMNETKRVKGTKEGARNKSKFRRDLTAMVRRLDIFLKLREAIEEFGAADWHDLIYIFKSLLRLLCENWF